MDRPFPPAELFDTLDSVYLPAPELTVWAKAMFIDDDALLVNPEHEHLQQAGIGFVWTNEANERRGRMILGTAQLLPPTGDKWSAGRARAQLRAWFGEIPNFLIILYGPAALTMDDRQFASLVEHELTHCAQRRSAEGVPMFSRETGQPLWAMKEHDVSEFVGVVKRYGSTSPELSEMVKAINHGPLLSDAEIARGCGTCLK